MEEFHFSKLSFFIETDMTEVVKPIQLDVELTDAAENEILDKLEESRSLTDILCSDSALGLTSPPPQPKIVLQQMESESVISEVAITVIEADVEDVISGALEDAEAGGSERAEMSDIEEPISQSGNVRATMEEQSEPNIEQEGPATGDQQVQDNEANGTKEEMVKKEAEEVILDKETEVEMVKTEAEEEERKRKEEEQAEE